MPIGEHFLLDFLLPFCNLTILNTDNSMGI